MKQSSFAQGTIEYLVIIAVVVVISLIIVGLVITTTSAPSQEIRDSSSGLGNVSSGGISIVDAVTDLGGDSLIRLSNNSSDAVTLTKISVSGVDNNYNAQLVGLDSKTFSLSDLSSGCKCVSGQKSVSCQFKLEYTTVSGILKTDYKTVTSQCVIDSTPVNSSKVVNPVVNVVLDSVAPSVLLLSPSDRNIFSGRNLVFDFNATDNNTISSCTLRVGSDSSTYTGLNNGVNTITYIKLGNDGLFDWNITCSDGTNSSTSASRRINMDANTSQISYCTELQDMNKNLSGNFELMNDIDCGLDTNNSSGRLWNGGAGFKPVGTSSSSGFTGTFNGNNHKVSNLYIRKSTDYLGLFGYSAGVISNVGLVDVNMIGTGSDIWWRGILAARQVGGSITNSYTTGTLLVVTGPTAALYIGGLMGHMQGGSLTNSYSLAHIIVTGSSNERIGGLVGFQESGVISNCYFGGDVNGRFSVGGLVGQEGQTLSATIMNSYSNGTVSGLSQIGGLVGFQQSASISNSYFSGTVSGGTSVGGIIGSANGNTLSNSFSTGPVLNVTSTPGGLVGLLQGSTISNSYWDIYLSGRSSCNQNISGVDSNLNCVSTYNTPSYYYSSSNAPLSNWTWGAGGNWVTTATYPKLAWQN